MNYKILLAGIFLLANTLQIAQAAPEDFLGSFSGTSTITVSGCPTLDQQF